jgi:type II secretory pathway pseudopilin PulG
MRGTRGFTLVELLIVLAVVIAVVSTVAALAFSARSQSDVNAMMQMLMSVENAVRTQHANRHDYAGLTTTSAVQSGAIPPGFATPSGALFVVRTPLGGAFGVGPSAYVNATTPVPGAPNQGFYLKASGLTRAACIALLMGTSENYQGIVVDTTAVAPGADNNQNYANFTPRVVTTKGTRITPAAATTACASANANSIRWETS